MSLFLRRSAARCAFRGPGAWVVLSPIEQAIRRKVEACSMGEMHPPTAAGEALLAEKLING